MIFRTVTWRSNWLVARPRKGAIPRPGMSILREVQSEGQVSAVAETGGLSEAEQQQRRSAMPAIFAKTPFLAWLGIEVERYEPDDVATRLPFRVELSNDGSTYHGGVVGAVIDTTGALAAWSNHDF